MLLVAYPERAAAERACSALSRRFGLSLRAGQAVRLADTKFFAAGLKNKVFAAVWHGGGSEKTLALLAALLEKIPSFSE